jgi:uncharacterized DUF497 family protein
MGTTVIIRRLIWDARNKKHIARHHVVPDEVEEVVFFGNPLPDKGDTHNRLVLIGETQGARILEVVLQNRGEGLWYPVTAYDASEEKKAVYRRERG